MKKKMLEKYCIDEIFKFFQKLRQKFSKTSVGKIFKQFYWKRFKILSKNSIESQILLKKFQENFVEKKLETFCWWNHQIHLWKKFGRNKFQEIFLRKIPRNRPFIKLWTKFAPLRRRRKKYLFIATKII